MGSESFGHSVINYYSREESGSCGYCSGSTGCERFGLWAHELTVTDYQDLIDRGWRRCGNYCYKPIMRETCCPMYTIRCAAKEFSLSKSQKRILKRVNRYLATGDKGTVKARSQLGGKDGSMDVDKVMDAERRVTAGQNYLPILNKSKIRPKQVAISTNLERNDKAVTSGPTAKVPCEESSEKAKHKRINRKYKKLKAMGLSDTEIARKMVEKKRYPVKKTLEDFIDCPLPANSAHKLEVRLVRSAPRSLEFSETYDAGFELYKRYQINIHKDPPWKLSNRSYDRFLVTSPLEAEFPQHASLFKKYQMAVHSEPEDECAADVFRSFLVASPLEAEGQYGSYHHQYWLDGQLIAVGVIDILPGCVSSVYFFYNPDYAFLCLGTYGALRELHLVRNLVKTHPELKYYYMGYYIHSCTKMRYKAAFKPSFLLCPEANTWHSIELAVNKLNAVKYSRLNEDESAVESALFDPSRIRVVYRERLIEVGNAKSLWTSMKSVLQEYCGLVGINCASRMIILID